MMVTLVLPPLTQLNAPYPSISYLARFLRDQGVPSRQRDLGLELALRVYSRAGLGAIFDAMEAAGPSTEAGWRALALRRQHEASIEPLIAYLQGRDRGLASRILDTPFLPRGPRLSRADLRPFGPHTLDDAARHLATLHLADLADLVAAEIDPGFGLARYHQQIAVAAASFDPFAERLSLTTLIDAFVDDLADSVEIAPNDVVGLSVPFPGNLYAALRIGRRLRQRGAYVVMGGGYVNTELREVTEPRLWECTDALTLDNGEGPLLAILDWRSGKGDRRHRTLTREGRHDAPPPETRTTHAAWYGDLPLHGYLQLVDGTNPAHRLWSDGRWNKITIAHGCYWKRCSFCDVNLDYIARFVPAETGRLVDAVQELAADTGQRGFHFVDEAAPPRAMRDFAIELLARGEAVSWWGNIRFERTFTPDLCRLLAASGLVAVTGGLEVASDRLLERMEKGVTVEQVARVARHFTDAGVMVHAYLMYGFPTETVQETIDSMELVRQLFAAGVLKSAFWHRFVLTRHSAIFPRPEAFGIEISGPARGGFAQNDVPHRDPAGADADAFDDPLAAALNAWMRGVDLDRPVTDWFVEPMPATTEAPDRIARALAEAEAPSGDGRVLWLGGDALEDDDGVVVHGVDGPIRLSVGHGDSPVLAELLGSCRPEHPPLTWSKVRPHLDARALGVIPRLLAAGLVIV